MKNKDLINRLSEFHYNLLSRDDFSKKLGVSIIRIFYCLLLNERYGKVFYETNADGRLISVCCGFYRYSEFKKRFILLIMITLLIKICIFKVSIKTILKELFCEIPTEVLKHEDSCLGFVGASKEFGMQGPLSLANNYKKTIAYLRSQECTNIWGSTLLENTDCHHFLIRNKFKIVGENISGKNYYLLELCVSKD